MTEERTAPGAAPVLETQAPWKRRHVLDLDDFRPGEIEAVMETADAMKEVLGREVPRVPALRGKTVVTLFYESSTRTRTSFELAAKALGADVISIGAGSSSVEKGESLVDTVRTLQAVGSQLLVIRHPSSGAPYLVARQVQLNVINAGDGWHAHPTQGLLDIYTMRSRLGDLRGKRVVIVGDIAHSRVARSNIWGLTALGADIVVCGPPTLLPYGLRPGEKGADEPPALPPVTVETDLDRALEGADVVMALRLQLERMSSGLLPSLREYMRLYQVNEERLARARPGALVMHPGPMNEGVEISPALARSAQSVIEEQVTNGVAVRMAVLYLLARGKP
ncbi:MAG: aspartate carbamoyltransferase catalytic subunit [Dehalococcoidia bacterium]